MAGKKRKKEKADDVMHGRSFEGAEYAATEREQTEAIERTVRAGQEEEPDDFVTDAELEARENDSNDRDRE